MLNKADAPKSFTDSAFTGSLADASADRAPRSSTNATIPPETEKVVAQNPTGIIKAEFDESGFVPKHPQAANAANLFEEWDDSSGDDSDQNASKSNSNF
jgi:hypothetical protein